MGQRSHQQTVAGTFGSEMTPTLYNQQEVIKYLASKFGIKEALLAKQNEVQQNIEMAMQLMNQQGMQR